MIGGLEVIKDKDALDQGVKGDKEVEGVKGVELVEVVELRHLIYMIELSNTLKFLHGYGLIHRDIKPSNIIVDEKTFSLKLIDFGISKRIKHNKLNTYTEKKGTILYEPPENYQFVTENLNNNKLADKSRSNLTNNSTNNSTNNNTKSINNTTSTNDLSKKVLISTKFDVWSFGLLLSQLFSNERPWLNLDKNKILLSLVHRDEFPVPTKIKSEKIKELIKDCTRIDIEQRISMNKVNNVLKDILKEKLKELSKSNKIEKLFKSPRESKYYFYI